MVIKVGDKWCKATTTWKFWWNFLAKSLFFSRYPSFSPFECPDAYKCYTFSESYGSRETREIKISTSKFDLEAQGILSPLWTQTGPWSDTASYEKISDHPDPIFPTNSIMEVKVGKDSAKENENCLLLQLHALQYRMDNLTNPMRYWSPSSQASVLWLESIIIVRNFLKGRSNLLSDSALLKWKVAINA